jgi:hypothetical protein
MKLLVVTNVSANYPSLRAIEQSLGYLGTPYEVVDTAGAAPTLSDGDCHGYYQGVIFAYGNDIYSISSWYPTLKNYEITFAARQLNWRVVPAVDFGLTPAGSSTGTATGTFTSAAEPIFFYANRATPVAISQLTTPASATTPTGGGTVTPLLTDASGNILSALTAFTDGRQFLSQTFDSNASDMHNLVLAYGLVNWVTQGLFLGEYHVYAAAQVDDVLITDSEWTPGTACTTNPDDPNLPQFQINAADVSSVVAWQNSLRTDSLLANFRLSMAFNGQGATQDATLTQALRNNQASFNWVDHTYSHLEPLNGATLPTITNEISQNRAVATSPVGLGLTANSANFSTANMVTPGVTGLDDPNVPGYLVANGIRYVVTDTSQVGKLNNGPNPSPNVGIVNSFAPGLYEVPRFPNNIFFNTANWADNRAEWNCIYQNDPNYSNYTAPAILDNISSQFLNNMLLGNMNPEMFHQTNLHFSDNAQELGLTSPYVSSLISDVYQATFNKYKKLYQFPVLSLPLDQLGQAMQNRDAYNRSGATASLVWTATSSANPPTTAPTVAISITVPSTATVPSAVIPITGLKSNGSEVYGGQNISHVTVTPGQTITLPVQ